MKIFHVNQKPDLKKKIQLINPDNLRNQSKLLPSYSKEWKNTVFFYNKNLLKNIPSNNININKIIRSYFNLFLKSSEKKDKEFKNTTFINFTEAKGKRLKKLQKSFQQWRNKKLQQWKQSSRKRHIKWLAKKERTFSKIFVSNAEIKYNNYNTKITLYIMNRENIIAKKRYYSFNKILMWNFLKKRYYKQYKKSLILIYNLVKKFDFNPLFVPSKIRKSQFIKQKFLFLKKFIYFKHKFLKIIINKIVFQYLKKYANKIMNIERKYFFNKAKLNNLYFLPKLSNLLNKILNKKIEFNIINMKSISNNSDILTKMLATLIKRRRKIFLNRDINSIFKKIRLSDLTNKRDQKPTILRNEVLKTYTNFRVVSDISRLKDLNYNNNFIKYNIPQVIFNSINYKKLSGVRIEVKGRLTKRYRADRAVYKFKYKGALRNRYSSYLGLSSVLFRGNTKSNISYSFFKSKRRIGSFAVKGWIGGK